MDLSLSFATTCLPDVIVIILFLSGSVDAFPADSLSSLSLSHKYTVYSMRITYSIHIPFSRNIPGDSNVAGASSEKRGMTRVFLASFSRGFFDLLSLSK